MSVNYYLVCPIASIAGKEDYLTYHFEQNLVSGSIVKIPFGKSSRLGVVSKLTAKPSFPTKPISSVLEDVLPPHLLLLSEWMSEYYATRLATVLQTILPAGLEKKRRTNQDATLLTSDIDEDRYTMPQATPEQKKAVHKIENSNTVTHLLHGVTGSGKTRVYQELAKRVINQEKSVLVLVPEIALTPQLFSAFKLLHKNVLVLHSKLTESERHAHWKMLRVSKEPWIIIGPRSVLFSPLQNIGLIVIDECHEPSYQQDQQPKYSALRVARKLADLKPGCKLVLGSATPSITDYFIAHSKNIPIHKLTRPTQKIQREVIVVDIKDRSQFSLHPLFSRKLLEEMNKSFVQNQQVLLFHNRRGTARTGLCSQCGWVAECKNCHIPLRLHHDQAILQCHVCGIKTPLPQTCPDCNKPALEFKGFGSKRIEAEVKKLFPKAMVARFDSDTAEDQQLHQRYTALHTGEVNFIIGTQAIAKGLDLPNLNTVGIIQADSELFIPDFASSERSFQLTTQVIGRAGRTGAPSNVIIQTLNPEHPVLRYAVEQNYQDFYNYEVAERKAEHMPPHTFLLQLSVGYASSNAAINAANLLKKRLTQQESSLLIRGPSPAFHEHRGNKHYQQLVVTSYERKVLLKIARELPQRWQFTLDPINLL